MPQVSVCPQCGASIHPSTTRCDYCGSYFDAPDGDPAAEMAAAPTPGDAAVAGLRALHKELNAYSGTGSNWTMGAGLLATPGVLACGIFWWRIGILWSLVAMVVTGFTGLMVLGLHLSRERARHFDRAFVDRLVAFEAEHGLDRAATAEMAKHHLPESSDLRQCIEKTVKKARPG